MDKQQVFDAIDRLDSHLAAVGWKGYDPFDGLSMPGSAHLTGNRHLLRIALQQSIRRFPVNLRPLLRIPKMPSSKGYGYCALAYLLLFQSTGKSVYLKKMESCLDWLIRFANTAYTGYCWGNHFSYESRHGTIPKGMPTIVWTSLIANVFIDAYEALDDDKYFRIAKSCGEFILNDIKRLKIDDNHLCLMYTPSLNGNKASWNGGIHNSNALGAWLLARLYHHTGEERFLELSQKAMRFTVHFQRPEGGWYYGESKKYHWIDSFHTGYVLEALHGYIEATGDNEFATALEKGYDYFCTRFFEKNGRPRYYNHKTYPIDIQCASQGIETFVRLRSMRSDSIDLAGRVAGWTTEHMQSPKGFFYYRQYPLITNKTDTFHWGQATMLCALSHLFNVL